MGDKFNFTLSDDSALDEMSKATNRKKSDVVRDALTLYQYMVRRVREDHIHIYVGKDKSDLTEVAITTLEKLRSK